jgi:sec-independent protein translocase protein TatA
MPTVLLIFEFLGTTELMVIALVALIIFGPRKLPEIGRSVGKSIAEFKRASDDFKRTWEYEVELEGRKPALDAATTTTEPATRADATTSTTTAGGVSAEEFVARASQYNVGGETVARGSSSSAHEALGESVAAGGGQAAPRGGEEEDELNAS